MVDAYGGRSCHDVGHHSRRIREDDAATFHRIVDDWDAATRRCKWRMEFEVDGVRIPGWEYSWRVYRVPEIMAHLRSAGFCEPKVLYTPCGGDAEDAEGGGGCGEDEAAAEDLSELDALDRLPNWLASVRTPAYYTSRC